MRLNYRTVLAGAPKAMLGLERVANSGLDDPRLLNLIKIRASQINGCAYCVGLHAGEAREQGETDERLDMVAVWREAECFGRAERAALAWCEALTLLPGCGAPDELFDELARRFTPEQVVALTLAIVAINGWNRLNVGFRTPMADAMKAAQAEGGLKAVDESRIVIGAMSPRLPMRASARLGRRDRSRRSSRPIPRLSSPGGKSRTRSWPRGQVIATMSAASPPNASSWQTAGFTG